MEYIEVTLRNFSSLVKRNDIKSPQWFAVPNDLLEHPDFFNISGDEFKAFVWICGVASKLNEATIRVYPDLCARRIAIDPKSVELTIEKLNGKRLDVTRVLRTSERVSYATEQDTTLQNTTLQNITTTAVVETTPPAADVFAFGDEDSILMALPEKNKTRWLKLYNNDSVFIETELIKAIGWYFDNPKKKPKAKRGWLTALSSWLGRSWDRRAKLTPSNSHGKPQVENLVKNPENLVWATTATSDTPLLKGAK